MGLRSEESQLTVFDRVEGMSAKLLSKLPTNLKYLLAGTGPVQFDGAPLAPELQLLLGLRTKMKSPGFSDMNVTEARKAILRDTLVFSGVHPEIKSQQDFSIPVSGGKLRARLYIPRKISGDAAVIFFHGGGFVLGSLETHEESCKLMAKESALPVLSIEYRKAPEFKYPIPVEDSYAGYLWALHHASQLGFSSEKLIVAGDSAGGNLAAVVSHKAIENKIQKPKAQFLIYASVDRVDHYPSLFLFKEGFFLTLKDMRWFQEHYLLDQEMDLGVPTISPLRSQWLSEMPPTFVVTADFDPLRDEGEAFAKRLTDSGVKAIVRRSPGLIHGFMNMIGVSQTAYQETAFISRMLRDIL